MEGKLGGELAEDGVQVYRLTGTGPGQQEIAL